MSGTASRRKGTTARRTRKNGANNNTVGCLFSAIGGFTAAFRQAGASVLWANEKDENAVKTFRRKSANVESSHKPIEDLSVKGDDLEPVDVLTAGFSCQTFSVAGMKKGFDDDRGTLLLYIIRLLREVGANDPNACCFSQLVELE